MLVLQAPGADERSSRERARSLHPVVEMPGSGEETGDLVVSEIPEHAAAA